MSWVHPTWQAHVFASDLTNISGNGGVNSRPMHLLVQIWIHLCVFIKLSPIYIIGNYKVYNSISPSNNEKCQFIHQMGHPLEFIQHASFSGNPGHWIQTMHKIGDSATGRTTCYRQSQIHRQAWNPELNLHTMPCPSHQMFSQTGKGIFPFWSFVFLISQHASSRVNQERTRVYLFTGISMLHLVMC